MFNSRYNFPKVCSSKIEYNNKYITVKSEDLLFTKKENEELHKEYYSTISPDFVVGIVVKDGKLLMIEQYRHPINSRNLEFLAGMVEDNETPDQAIIKELREEGGIVPKNIEFLGMFNPLSGSSSNKGYVYLITDFDEVEQELELYEEFAGLVKFWYSIEQFKHLIALGELNDGVTLASWCLYLENIV